MHEARVSESTGTAKDLTAAKGLAFSTAFLSIPCTHSLAQVLSPDVSSSQVAQVADGGVLGAARGDGCRALTAWADKSG